MKDHHKYLSTYEKISREYILSNLCPLSTEQKRQVYLKRKRRLIKAVLLAGMKMRWNELVINLQLLNTW
jgi:hypothetical protein